MKNIRWALAAMAAAVLLMLTVGTTYIPVHAFFNAKHIHSVFNTFIVVAKQFPSVTSFVVLIAVVWQHDSKRRRTLAWLLVAIFFSGTVNSGIKNIANRTRPAYSVDVDRKSKKKIREYIKAHPQTALTEDSRDRWFWLAPNRPSGDGYQSFPSGHSNSAFVLASYLCYVYPNTRVVWLTLAGGCAAARVAQGRHHPEDTLFGGGLGWLLAQWVFCWAWPGRLWDGISSRLSRRRFTDESAPVPPGEIR